MATSWSATAAGTRILTVTTLQPTRVVLVDINPAAAIQDKVATREVTTIQIKGVKVNKVVPGLVKLHVNS